MYFEGGVTYDDLVERFGLKYHTIKKCIQAHKKATGTHTPTQTFHKVSKETKDAIVAKYNEGGHSYSSLAKEFGVSPPSVRKYVLAAKEER